LATFAAFALALRFAEGNHGAARLEPARGGSKPLEGVSRDAGVEGGGKVHREANGLLEERASGLSPLGHLARLEDPVGRRLLGEIYCQTCGADARRRGGRETHVLHAPPLAENHVLVGRSPGYSSGRVVVVPDELGPDAQVVIPLRPDFPARLELTTRDPGSAVSESYAWEVDRYGGGRDRSGRGAYRCEPIAWEARDPPSSPFTHMRATLPLHRDVSLINTALGGRVGFVAAGAIAEIEDHSALHRVDLTCATGLPRPLFLTAIEQVGGRDRFMPRSVGSRDFVEFGTDPEGPFELTLDPSLGVRFARVQESAAVTYVDSQSVRFQPTLDARPAVAVEASGWRFEVVDALDGSAIDEDLTIDVALVGPGGVELEVGSMNVPAQRRGLFALGRVLPLGESSRVRMILTGSEGSSRTVLLDQDDEAALQTSKTGARFRLLLDPPPTVLYRLRFSPPVAMFAGESLVVRSSSGRTRARLITAGGTQTSPFSIAPGAYVLTRGNDGTKVGAFEVTGKEPTRGVERCRVIELALGTLVEVQIALPDAQLTSRAPDLFCANRAGSIVPFALTDGVSGVVSTRVPPGQYCAGPLDWVTNECHRITKANTDSFEVTAAGPRRIEIAWDPRWGARAGPLPSLALNGFESTQLALVPVFSDSSAQFICADAPLVLPVPRDGSSTDTGLYTQPFGFALVARVQGLHSSRPVPLGFLRSGRTYPLRRSRATLSVSPAFQGQLRREGHFAFVPKCLQWDFRRHELTGWRSGAVAITPVIDSMTEFTARTGHGWTPLREYEPEGLELRIE
ncbi:MAG: hypothetical protein AAFR54_19660, partial [Planctomycetota bacterium]